MFATAVPGLAPLLAREIDVTEGLSSRDSGFDGRSDVVLFDAVPSAARHALTLRLAEDVYAEVGRTLRSEGDRPGWIAGRIWRPERAARALTTKATVGRTPGRRATFRVITRVLQERSFLRTDLRRELTQAVLRTQPDWRFADPAEVEVWISEYTHGKLVAGVRLSDASMRQHDGRTVERGGALRPTVAAAMVDLAGSPGGVLLDPCCGRGRSSPRRQPRAGRLRGRTSIRRRSRPPATTSRTQPSRKATPESWRSRMRPWTLMCRTFPLDSSTPCRQRWSSGSQRCWRRLLG
jgi:23S rRNA G2445 N2-methylase RlmL